MSTHTTIPPPLAHRHDFEEMFHVLEGEVDVTIRGETSNANIGEKVNVPAPATPLIPQPDRSTVLLCLVAPAGIEAYFAAFGDPVPNRTSPAPLTCWRRLRDRLADPRSTCRSGRCCATSRDQRR